MEVNRDGTKAAELYSSGFGGCLRGRHGKWLVGFMGFGHDASVLTMQLMAVYRGLQLAWDEGYRRVVCFSDSLLPVSLIRSPQLAFHENAVVIGTICDLLNRAV